MQTDLIRIVRGTVLFVAGVLALPGSMPADEVAVSASPSLSDLSPNLSLAMPLAGPGVQEGQVAPVTAPRDGHLAAKTGLGFTLSPDDFLLILQADYFLTNNFSIGPLLQFGVDDDPFIFAPTLNFQGMFDLPGAGMERLKPFVQGGIGVVYMNKDRPNRPNVDDTGFLINVGGGFEYFVTDRLSLGNNIMFNIMPDDVLGDHFFFSWQFVTVRYQF
jgi:hypothetical protein